MEVRVKQWRAVSLLTNWTLLFFPRVTYSATCATFNVTLSYPGPENSLASKMTYLQKIPCPRKLEVLDAHDPANACLKGKVYK